MKRFLALFLVLVMIFSMLPAMSAVAKAETATETESVPDKPFYGLTWHDVDRTQFDYLGYAPVITVKNESGTAKLGYSASYYAKTIKAKLDALPEGMRHIRIHGSLKAMQASAECVIYADNGVAQVKKLMTDFIEAYYALGGKLDGIILDTEYFAMNSWYLYKDTYGGYYEDKAPEGSNRNLYVDIVNHPQYQTEIRPALEEMGFVFYENVGGNKSEIWSMFPNQFFSGTSKTKYANCESIWNKLMTNRISAYMTDAFYAPLITRYPDAVVSDYQRTDSATWENFMSTSGVVGTTTGNYYKTGNASNYNMYNSGPTSGFFKDDDGNYLYKNIASYNKAVYDDDAYNSLLFNVNQFKSMYAATDTKKVSVWVDEYDYSGRNNSTKNSPYYTEFMYHVGMLDPQPFLVWLARDTTKFKGDEGLIAYNARMKVIDQFLEELTRVAGYSDRKPIVTPQSWNDGFVLSGMYANGRNIWRLTPDTTDGMTLEAFKIEGDDPTFSINGNTITFPGGNIIEDSPIDVVGTCGYWIETAKDVQPIITREADRYAKYPSYQESFSYADGTIFNGENAKEKQAWEADADLLIENGAVALTGTATLNNVKIPKNITAGDSYAKQQAWEISFTLADALTTGSATLFNGLVKLENGKLYYNSNGAYVALAAITAGTKYTIRIDNNFNIDTATYTLSAAGAVVAKAENITVPAVTTPVSAISMTGTDLAAKVYLDDYKLYPSGLEYTIKGYNADNGLLLSSAENMTKSKVAFRLTWMNATAGEAKGQIRVARYDENGNLVSDTVLKTIEMKPGWDGAETGVLENTTGSLTVYLKVCKIADLEIQNKKAATCTEDGYTGDLVCKDCGEIHEKGSVIPSAGGHKKVALAGKAADCCTDGLTEGEKCSVCGEILVAQTVIPAKGHTEKILTGKAATCTATGLTEGKLCTDCDEVLVAQTVIPAKGHAHGAPVQENVVKPVDDKDGSYDLVVYCTACGAELSREAMVIPAPKALPTSYTLKIDGVSYTLSTYDTPVYSVNTTKTGYFNTVANSAVTESVTADYIGQVLGGDESSYNAKLIWHTGDEAPTLYLRNLIVDNYNETLGLWRYSSAANKNYIANAAIFTGSTAPLKIVIQGGESRIQTYDGIHYRQELTIESVGDASLKLETNRTGIVPAKVSSGYINDGDLLSGNKLTLAANLNVSLEAFANERNSGYVIRTVGADMIINGGNIVTEYTGAAKNVRGIGVVDSGNLYVNGGYVYAESYSTANLTDAAYRVAGNVYVTGGTLEAYSQYQSGVRAKNIYVTGGTVKTNTSYAGLLVTAQTGMIAITGGAVEADPRAAGGYAFAYMYKNGTKDAQGVKIPVLADSAIVTAGSNADSAVVVDAATYDFTGRYVKVAYPVVASGCSHAQQTIPAKAPTCTEIGLTEGKKCAACGGILVAQEVIPANGHTEETLQAKAPTCTKTGLTEGKKCADCGEILAAQEVIPATGHTEEMLAGYAATCTETGLTEGKKCATCGEILAAQEVIPAKGHTEVIDAAKAATCTETGLTQGKHCSVCNEILVAQEIVAAKGHTEEVIAGQAATCTETGLTEGKKCSVCAEILVAQSVISAKGHTEEVLPSQAATCTETGLTEGKKCADCGEILATQEVISATGHSAANSVMENVTATAYERVVYCATCGQELSRETIEGYNATVTLWGKKVVIDQSDKTADVPAAYYWVNNGTAAPLAAEAEDNWNYAFTIIDGIPTVTIRNADFQYAQSFLYAKYDGNLALVFEGTNHFVVPYSASASRYFLNYSAATNSVGKGHLYITGAENAVLNVTGGDDSQSMIVAGNKAYVTISGGSISVEKTKAGGTSTIVNLPYCKTTIENCNLTVKNNITTVANQRPIMVAGYGNYGVTISNSNIHIEGYGIIGLLAGVWNINSGSVNYPATLTITGNSDVQVINKYSNSITCSGTGIYAKTIAVKSGTVEAEGVTKAYNIAPDLASYNGEYELTDTTTYYKVCCKHAAQIIAGYAATCTADGLTDGEKCAYCGVELAAQEVIPATGHTEEIISGYAATCTTDGLTEGKKCATCDEILAAQEVIPVTGHSAEAPVMENVTATAYERVVYCGTCDAELSRETIEGYNATVTLWGKKVVIDQSEKTADVPAAYYWVNNGTAAPLAAEAEDDWNYAFSIIDGVPTVTIRNADFQYNQSFLYAKYDGSLKLAYEGTNNFIVPFSSSATRYFLNYSAATNSPGKGNLYIVGAENAVLNVTGGDNSQSMIVTNNKVYVTISGGTIFVEKTNAGGTSTIVNLPYSKTKIENCNLTVKNSVKTVSDQRPVMVAGYSSYGVTISNSNVHIEGYGIVGLMVGVWNINSGKVDYPATLTISGNSNVKVINKYSNDRACSGTGIYAKAIVVKGGSLEVEAMNRALQITGTGAAPDLSGYAGEYKLFTAADGEAVDQYTQTTYFKVSA